LAGAYETIWSKRRQSCCEFEMREDGDMAEKTETLERGDIYFFYRPKVNKPEVDSLSPAARGLSPERQADYPKHLMEQFRDRQFAELEPPDFLNHEGTEFVLIASSGDVKKDLDIELETESEDRYSADIFKDLKLDRQEHPTEPLLAGEWA
jgi:hypothetical protein